MLILTSDLLRGGIDIQYLLRPPLGTFSCQEKSKILGSFIKQQTFTLQAALDVLLALFSVLTLSVYTLRLWTLQPM